MKLFPTVVVATASLITANLSAQSPLPEGAGLSARYPGDAGLGRDPAVLLAENFESGDLADLAKRWDSVSNQDGKVLALVADGPVPAAGRRALQSTATLGQNTGGHLYTRLPRPVDLAFLRFYVKFEPDAAYIHHFVHFGGYRPATTWPQGGAGTRPAGDERITVGIEPHGHYGRYPAPGTWTFYNYWHEMKGSADGKFWGNGLSPVAPAVIPRDRWQCVEVMLKLNSAPDRSDGELALWLDGKLTAHFASGARRSRWTGMGFQLLEEGGEPFAGFRWRTHPELKINFLWLLHYVTENAARQNQVTHPKTTNTVWFDDLVVATEYIGPIQP